MPHQFCLQRVYNETFSATWSTNNQPLLFSLICLTHSACTQLFSVFFVSAHIFMCKCCSLSKLM